MKKMLFLLVYVCLGSAVCLITGCEWTSGGGVDAWDSSMNFVDVSGVYRSDNGGILVREFADSSTTNHVSESVGSGDGSRTEFTHRLRSAPVPGSLMVTVGAYIFTDSAGGGTNAVTSSTLSVNQSDGSSGTINYSTAIVTLSFPAPLASETPISASYLSLHQSSGQGNHGEAIYTFTVFQQGNRVNIVDSNGTTYDGYIGSVRTTGGRPNEDVARDPLTGELLGSSDTSSTLPDGPVSAQFSATANSQGYDVTLVGIFHGNLIRSAFNNRTITGTYMERGGYQADFSGVADNTAVANNTNTTTTTN